MLTSCRPEGFAAHFERCVLHNSNLLNIISKKIAVKVEIIYAITGTIAPVFISGILLPLI
jgi:hypothetical protein